MFGFSENKRPSGIKRELPGRSFAFPGRESRSRTDWSVPWSDLMMVMFILFLVLFVYSTRLQVIPRFSGGNSLETQQEINGGRTRYVVASTEMQKNLQGIFHRLENELQGFADMTRLSHSDNGIVISLHGESIFAPGEPALSSDARPVLEKIAGVLFLVQGQVLVAGYSDRFASTGRIGREDMELYALRAVQVTCFFTEENGLEPEMFVVQGYGPSRPLYPETTPENVSRNQRVEITITGHQV